MAKELSESERTAMALALENRLGSWDVGAGTLGSLKRKGWVVEIRVDHRFTSGRRYGLTPVGLEVWRERGG